MLSTRSTLFPVALIAVAACSGEPSAPAPVEVPLPLSVALAPALNNSNGVVLRVSGAGTVNFTAGGSSLAPFQFIAWKQADGTVGGHFRQSRFGPLGTVDFEGEVTCVSADPNFPGRARIGGIVTANNSTDSRFLTANHEVGDEVWFRVESGAAGADGGDKSSTYGFSPTLVTTSAAYCALSFDPTVTIGSPPVLVWNPAALFPLAQGNITIHQ
jgi:hypothetical protein